MLVKLLKERQFENPTGRKTVSFSYCEVGLVVAALRLRRRNSTFFAGMG